MTADARNTEIASTLAKLAALMAEQNNDERPDLPEEKPQDDSSKRVLLTVEETAKRLNIGRTKTYSLVKSGEIGSVQIGKLRRVPAEEVEAYASRLISDQSAA